MRRLINDHQPESATSSIVRIDGVVVGMLSGFDAANQPLVTAPGIADQRPARSTVTLSPAEQGREVALMFEAGDPEKPIVIGLMHQHAPVEVAVDKKRLVFDAEQEIVLRCGKSSITLTKAGKVLIRGEYLLSRSSGVNRIKGGSVQIN